MEKIAYHTPTKQSMIDRAKKWKEEGTEVYDGFLSGEYWENYKEKTCVDIEDNRMSCQNKNFYKEKGYKIIPYEKKLEYGYCDEGDMVVHEDGDEVEIIKVTEEGLWKEEWRESGTAYFYTWEYVKARGWKIKQPTEDTITVKMKRSDYDTLKDIELEVVDNSK